MASETGYSGSSGEQPQGINLEQLLFDALTSAVKTLPEAFQEGDPEAVISPDTFASFYHEFQLQVRDRLRAAIEDIQARASLLVFPKPGLIQ